MNVTSLFLEDAVVVPRIASLEVRQLGVIRHAALKFPSRVTVIDASRALGASTLLHSIAAIAGRPLPRQLLSCSGDENGLISATFERKGAEIRLTSLSYSEVPQAAMTSERGVAQLGNMTSTTSSDQCLVLDKEVFGCFDISRSHEAFDLIAACECQVIAFLSIATRPIPDLYGWLQYRLIRDPDVPELSTIIPVIP